METPLRKIKTQKIKNALPVHRITWMTEEFQRRILKHLERMLARDPHTAELRDWWLADCYAIRDRILQRFMVTQSRQHHANARRIYYFSMEYLMGRLLATNLDNCGLLNLNKKALREMGFSFDKIQEEEPDMGLGNGGLGRLAACYMDSLATLNYPCVGYGIHYEFGLFKQTFENLQQKELADNWVLFGNPWQILRPEETQTVRVYGHVEDSVDENGNWQPLWVTDRSAIGVPWDVPIVGYGAETVNFLRLWECRATEEFDFDQFNSGSYIEAVRRKSQSETVTKVLYPNDSSDGGKELRFVQQYFFVSCSLRDIIRRHFEAKNTWDNFTEKVCIQLNDTHPTIGIVELMRILLDEEKMDWDRAWNITRNVFAYTNHTLLPEALEKWSVQLFKKVLPRHLQIIYEINRRFLEEVEAKWPGNDTKKRELSIIEEGSIQFVRMAYLAVIGSFSVNGVAEMHSELVKQILFPAFAELWPEKFCNVTNGVTPRRWIKTANPALAEFLTEKVGPQWIVNLEDLHGLERYVNDDAVLKEFAKIKQNNKDLLAQFIKERCGLEVDSHAIFDVQIKRIHEYKRQHLNLLHILTLYYRLLNYPEMDLPPRVFVFSGKAAPGYKMAKDIIYAINLVAEKIDNDERLKGKLKVAFIPNYDVSAAMKIIPAADISEQISTAGTEASGTGNMKLAMNGAITIGTLDGANVEMLEEIGKENIFIFGHTAPELYELKQKGYCPTKYYEEDHELHTILDWMMSTAFERPNEFNPLRSIAEHLLHQGDRFFVLADYRSYIDTHQLVAETYRDTKRWTQMSLLNVARMGKFSSDRSIQDYVRDIWHLQPVLGENNEK